MTHKGKIDVWILAAILLAIVVLMVVGDYWIAGPVLFILLLCAWPQTYQTTPRGLLIRAGLVRRFIPYEAITFVGPSMEGAWFERIRIEYGPSGAFLIAPEDPRHFLDDIQSRAAHLCRCGQDLVTMSV